MQMQFSRMWASDMEKGSFPFREKVRACSRAGGECGDKQQCYSVSLPSPQPSPEGEGLIGLVLTCVALIEPTLPTRGRG